jgi:uncharacterized integral membrane protein (TIGR00697 family)
MIKSTAEGLPQYKFFLLLTMISFMGLIICDIICYKVILFNSLALPASAFVYPMTYVIGDIIAEVYGYQLSRQLIWYSLACQFAFSLIVTYFINLPSPEYWHNQAAYEIVLGGLIRQAIASTCGILVASFVNAYIISKFKIIMHGKRFWVRNLIATAIGEGILCIISYHILFVGKYSYPHIYYFIWSAWLYKCLYAVIIVYPASLVVAYIKQKEGFDLYDYNVNYNPFALSVR